MQRMQKIHYKNDCMIYLNVRIIIHEDNEYDNTVLYVIICVVHARLFEDK